MRPRPILFLASLLLLLPLSALAQQTSAPPPKQDPEYYAARLAPLRAELSQVDSKLYRLQNMPTDYRTGSRVETVGGVAVTSVTIENEVQRLQNRRATLQRRIDEIRAEAERNGLSVR